MLIPQAIVEEGASSALTVVTSLPVSPSDGNEVLLKVGSGDTAVLWHMKYDASVSDAYKWRFLGGVPLAARVNTGEATSSGTYTDLATVGPLVTIPYTGVYDVRHGCFSVGNVPIQGVQSNGSGPADDDEACISGSGAAAANTATEFRRTIASIGSSADVKCLYRVGAASTFYRRWLVVTAVRIG